jgi:hypothetical protein
MNSSSRICRSGDSPPLMWSRCICIAVPLSLSRSRRGCRARPGSLVLSLRLGAGGLANRQSLDLDPARCPLGHQLQPEPVRTTACAPALPPPSPHTAPPSGYAPPQVDLPWKAGRFSGPDFALQPDGTLRCQASQQLLPHEHRRARRWELARGVWRQHPQLSSRSVAKASPVAGQRHRQAAPGQCEARISSPSGVSRSSGVTGAADSIGGPA